VRHAASAWAAAAVISSDLAQLPPRVLTGARGGGIGGIGSMSEGERGTGGGGDGDGANFNAPNAAVSAVVGSTESDSGAVVSAATASAAYVLDPKRPP
jgi:hypothetical protein